MTIIFLEAFFFSVFVILTHSGITALPVASSQHDLSPGTISSSMNISGIMRQPAPYYPPLPPPMFISLPPTPLRQVDVTPSSCSNDDSMCIAREMFEINNDIRASSNRPRQVFNCRLFQLALEYSETLSTLPGLRHNTREFFRANSINAENIASGRGGNTVSSGRFPSRLMNQWYNSAGHRENILRDIESVGVAAFVTGDEWYGTQMFGPMLEGDDSCMRSGRDAPSGEEPTMEPTMEALPGAPTGCRRTPCVCQP